MPANLPPEYFEAEHRYRAAREPAEKLEALKEMIALVPHHKGTERLFVDLKKRQKKLEDQLAQKKASGARSPFPDHIEKEGIGQIVLMGPPNSGKSSLLAGITNARPAIAPYPFSTFKPTVGMAPFEDVQMQVVDLPPIWSETEGWVYNIIRTSDALALVVSLASENLQNEIREVLALLEQNKIVPGNQSSWDSARRVTVKRMALVATHLDVPGANERFVHLRDAPFAVERVAISSLLRVNLDHLLRCFFKVLRVVRVYTKKPGEPPARKTPFVIKAGSTVIDLAYAVHNDIGKAFKYARVWGSAEYPGMRVERTFALQDGDIVEIHS